MLSDGPWGACRALTSNLLLQATGVEAYAVHEPRNLAIVHNDTS
jgi:hypothetical protein